MSDDRRTALTPVTILDRAVGANASPDVIEKLMGLQERWERHQAEKAFRAALAEAKADFPAIIKNNKVDQGRGRPTYSYEDLFSICEAVDTPLHDRGLYYNWRTHTEQNGRVTVTCILSHAQGYSEESSLTAPPDVTGAKNPVQSVGSTVSYLQRYTLKAALGLAAAPDDDGRADANIVRPPPLVEVLHVAQPDPEELIDVERVNEITRLKDEADLSAEALATLLGKMNVTTISEISTPHYTRVVKYLNAVIERNKERKEQEEHADDATGEN